MIADDQSSKFTAQQNPDDNQTDHQAINQRKDNNLIAIKTKIPRRNKQASIHQTIKVKSSQPLVSSEIELLQPSDL